MQLTIKKLRKAGFKVRVMHTRKYDMIAKGLSTPFPHLSCKGGMTKIEVTTPDKVHTYFGFANCSLQDNFNRKLGNSIALGRAISELVQHDSVKELLEVL